MFSCILYYVLLLLLLLLYLMKYNPEIFNVTTWWRFKIINDWKLSSHDIINKFSSNIDNIRWFYVIVIFEWVDQVYVFLGLYFFLWKFQECHFQQHNNHTQRLNSLCQWQFPSHFQAIYPGLFCESSFISFIFHIHIHEYKTVDDTLEKNLDIV